MKYYTCHGKYQKIFATFGVRQLDQRDANSSWSLAALIQISSVTDGRTDGETVAYIALVCSKNTNR